MTIGRMTLILPFFISIILELEKKWQIKFWGKLLQNFDTKYCFQHIFERFVAEILQTTSMQQYSTQPYREYLQKFCKIFVKWTIDHSGQPNDARILHFNRRNYFSRCHPTIGLSILIQVCWKKFSRKQRNPFWFTFGMIWAKIYRIR